MPEIIIRRYRDGDEYQIVELFKKIFGRTMSLDEWHWKYKGQGNKEVLSFVVTDKEDKVIGHYGGIPLRMTYKGNTIAGISTCDVMIDKKFRGLWTLKRLHNSFVDFHIKKGIRMFYGFPTEKTLLLPSEKLGLYERVETILEASKDVVFNKGIERFLYKLTPIDLKDPQVDKLWRFVKTDFPFSVIRDSLYLSWRYEKNPLFSYEAWGLKRRWGKELLGLAILRQKDDSELLLMELISKKIYSKVLLKKIENLAFVKNKKRLILWLPQRVHSLLKDLGFSFRPSGATLPRATNSETIPREEIISYFYYTCGDTDFL